MEGKEEKKDDDVAPVVAPPSNEPIVWKSIRALKWSRELYEQVKEFVATGKLPPKDESPEGLKTRTRRWRKRYRHFAIEAGAGVSGAAPLVLVIQRPEDVFWAVDKEGNKLFDVPLPYSLTVVPDDSKDAILNKVWPELTENAYRSAATFYERLSKQFVGITRDDVTKWLQKQEIHQIYTAAPRSVMQPIVTTRCNQQWEMDLIDLKSLHSAMMAGESFGYHFLLTVVDCFSKMCWVRPLKHKTSAEVGASLQSIILGYGAPETISSDNGAEFVNEDMTQLAERFNIHLRHSLPHNPRAQGQVERLNGTIKRSIAKFLAGRRGSHNTPGLSWTHALQFLVYGYNTSVHKTSKFAPMAVYFHRDVRTKQSNKPPIAELTTSALVKLVAQNIQKKADAMILNDLKKNSQLLVPLHLGDRVRISMLTLADQRKQSVLISKSTTAKWSREVYWISFMRPAAEDAEAAVYFVQDKDGIVYQEANNGVVADKPFYRWQLKKLDMTEDEIKGGAGDAPLPPGVADDEVDGGLWFGLKNLEKIGLPESATSALGDSKRESKEQSPPEPPSDDESEERPKKSRVRRPTKSDQYDPELVQAMAEIAAQEAKVKAKPKVKRARAKVNRSPVYQVKEIHERRTSSSNPEAQYLIEWDGYPAKKDWTWEPQSGIEHTSVFQDYLVGVAPL